MYSEVYSRNLISRYMIIGEAPGESESRVGRPFVGKSGQAQEAQLQRYGLSDKYFYITNVVKSYILGNPDPTRELIDRWTPYLLDEIRQCQPKLIVCCGRFAARFFLDSSVLMEDIYGIPHRATKHLDVLPPDCIILPIYHPAAAMHKEADKSNSRMVEMVAAGYKAVCDTVHRLRAGVKIDVRHDEYAGREEYLDVTGHELVDYLCTQMLDTDSIALDTEGTPNNPWSIQISIQPGTGLTLRVSQPDFSYGVKFLQEIVNRGARIITHQATTPTGCMYDTIMCRVMGLELRRANIWDTMYAAYLLQLPQGLKTLAYRYCHMAMEDYQSLIEEVGCDKQIIYLQRVIDRKFPKPDIQFILENDGTSRLYQPESVSRTCNRIVNDYLLGKVNRKGEEVEVNPAKRWLKIDKRLRRMVESSLGERFPFATLDDISLDKAVYYSSKDSDATLRLAMIFEKMLGEMNQ